MFFEPQSILHIKSDNDEVDTFIFGSSTSGIAFLLPVLPIRTNSLISSKLLLSVSFRLELGELFWLDDDDDDDDVDEIFAERVLWDADAVVVFEADVVIVAIKSNGIFTLSALLLVI